MEAPNRFSENNKNNTKSAEHFEHINNSSSFSHENSGQSPLLNSKKGYKSLLDLIKKDSKAKLWDCILKSIVTINDFCEKGLEKNTSLSDILSDQICFLNLCKRKQNIKLQQIVFNKKETELDAMLQIKSQSNPLRRLDSRDQKHKMFIEKSLQKEKRIDYSMNFKITEYAYELFAELRKLNNITIDSITESFDIGKNIEMHINNASEFFGRSGSTFFFTNDNKFVLKSISTNNALNFINIFPKYFDYLLKNNEISLMVRIYGLYKIKVEGYEKTFFILMENLMENLLDHLILRVYDLKGSKFQRNQENFKNDIKDQNMILQNIFGENLNENLHEITNTFLTDQILIVRGKDCDFIESDDSCINLLKHDEDIFLESLNNDVKLFFDCNLMDYSLIFIKALKNPSSAKLQSKNSSKNFFKMFRSYESSDKKFIYSLAIVDYLQNYDFLKLMETQLKSFFKEKPEEISCVDPEYYRNRFLKFIFSIVDSEK